MTAGAASHLPICGFPSSTRTFRDVIPALSKTATVIVPDLPGFGESSSWARPMSRIPD